MPAPVRVVTSIIVRRPAVDVWPFLVDWEHLDRWMGDIRGVRVTSRHREGIGVEAEATVRIGGITTRDRVRVTRWEPPTVLEIAHLGWVRGTGHMELVPTEGGSRLLWRETFIPPWGIVGAVGIRVFRPLLKRVFIRDLRRLRDLVEG
jgi:uncharacterized protein YndB with AHSA1/START domain